MAFKKRCSHPYKLISDSEVEQIHQASLQMLSELGCRFDDAAACHLLVEHGCAVDWDQQVVSFPPDLVELALRQCPNTFTLRARNPAYNIVFDDESVHFSAGSGMDVLDVPSMQRRSPTTADALDSVRLCDALGNIAGANTGLGSLSDKPEAVAMEWLYALALRNSEKITSVSVMNDSEKWGIRMAQAAGVDIIVSVNSSSPLGWTADQAEGARRAVAAGLPVGLQSMASPGVTAPATLAGTAVVMNAEILAMAVYLQLLRPGTGVMYSCFAIPLDMKTTMLASGSIELGMLTVVSAQMSKYYRMGSIVCLPMTDSHVPDQQAGYEKAMQWLLAGMSGINLIWGAGMVAGHSLWSLAQLVIDAEMAGMVGRHLDGMTVTEEMLALDVIRAVGHFPGSYLETEHTLRWWRGERYLPLISSRNSFVDWQEHGSRDVLRRADEKARVLLARHEPVPLPDEADREIGRLLQAAAKEKRAG
jgi:trimethylamine--corrinoid protein Co-methyltransferase